MGVSLRERVSPERHHSSHGVGTNTGQRIRELHVSREGTAREREAESQVADRQPTPNWITIEISRHYPRTGCVG